MKAARQEIHRTIDPIWKSGRVGRTQLYSMIAHLIGVEAYHTAEIRTINQAQDVVRVARELEASL